MRFFILLILNFIFTQSLIQNTNGNRLNFPKFPGAHKDSVKPTFGCDEYPITSPKHTEDCQCGVPGSPTRIVGGVNAPKNFYEWHCGLSFRGQKPFCGATLINSQYVVTAAHCVFLTGLINFPGAGQLVFNDYDISKSDETKTIVRGIDKIIPHECYNEDTQDYDVTLIKFSPPINLTATNEPKVSPICLPSNGDKSDFVNKTGTVIGWGTTSEGGSQPNILMEVKLPVITKEECEKAYSDGITDRMLCAGVPEGQKDSCQGDSGGSLTIEIPDPQDILRFMQIGVVSWGEGCARPNKPGVYTRVTEVNNWVRFHANDGTYCQEMI